MKYELTWIFEDKIRKEYYSTLDEIIEAFELDVKEDSFGTHIDDGINSRYFPGDRESSISVWFTMYNTDVGYYLRRIDEKQT